MRRIHWPLILILAGLATPVQAQIGKYVPIPMNSPEGKALDEIDAAADVQQKQALAEKFLADYGKGDMAIVAYGQLVDIYMSEKNYEKVYEYGEKLFGVDPDNFINGVNMVRAAQEQGDTAKLMMYAEKVGAIVSRYKAQGQPEGVTEEDWKGKKQQALDEIKENLAYVQQGAFVAAYRTQDPAARAAMLLRFAAAFPESVYANQALGLAATSYQQAQNYTKMIEVANGILATDPNSTGMLILLADYYSEKREQLDKVDAYSKKALELLAAAKKPDGVTDEQWQQQISLQKGLVLSSLGQMNIEQKHNPEAVVNLEAAAPLLKPNAVTYARNQYRLGFALLNLQKVEEGRAALIEAASIDSPYKGLAQTKLRTLPPAPAKAKKKS